MCLAKVTLTHLAFLLALCASSVRAEDCATSCGDQCRVKIEPPKICSPFGGCVQIGGGAEFIEPACNAKCETFKAASCLTGLKLPTVPITPREVVHTFGMLACTLPQQIVLHTISSRCNFISVQQNENDQEIIERAKSLLLERGILEPEDFVGVEISMCDAVHGQGGVVPDRDRIFIHSSWRERADLPNRMIGLAGLLAHEMFHVRQYREWGADKFKCDYARQMVECGMCQDLGNSIERSAYEFGDSAVKALMRDEFARGVPMRIR